MTVYELTLIGLAGLCTLALPVLVLLSMRNARRIRALGMPMQASDADKIAERLGTGQDAALRSLTDQLEAIRRDFDWLVSDRMIQQAIDMARTGQASESIAQQTGISSSELEAIQKLRH